MIPNFLSHDSSESHFQPDDLIEMSLKYSTGDGVDLDYINAHVCLNLAVSMGAEDAAEMRRQIALEMSPSEIAKAQKMARQFLQNGQPDYLN